MAHNGTRRPLCLRLVLGVLVDGGVLRCRDIVDRMDLPLSDRIVPKALARLSALGLVIKHAGPAKEWEATASGRAAWASYFAALMMEIAAA